MVCCARSAMFKFRGFKASFNLLSGKKKSKEQYEKPSDIPILGAYRGYSEDYFGTNKYNRQPSTIPNTSEPTSGMKPSKSTSDLATQNERKKDTRKSTSDLPSSTEQRNGKSAKICERERKKLEKQRSEEHKRRERNYQAEEVRRQNYDAQHRLSKEGKPKRERKKTPAPQPPNTDRNSTNYSSGTLESSISRSSGPPPYSEEPVPNHNDNTGNTSFGKPVETSSWDLVSQHRQQLSKPLAKRPVKTTVLDLGYHTQVERGRDKNV